MPATVHEEHVRTAVHRLAALAEAQRPRTKEKLCTWLERKGGCFLRDHSLVTPWALAAALHDAVEDEDLRHALKFFTMAPAQREEPSVREVAPQAGSSAVARPASAWGAAAAQAEASPADAESPSAEVGPTPASAAAPEQASGPLDEAAQTSAAASASGAEEQAAAAGQDQASGPNEDTAQTSASASASGAAVQAHDEGAFQAAVQYARRALPKEFATLPQRQQGAWLCDFACARLRAKPSDLLAELVRRGLVVEEPPNCERIRYALKDCGVPAPMKVGAWEPSALVKKAAGMSTFVVQNLHFPGSFYGPKGENVVAIRSQLRSLGCELEIKKEEKSIQVHPRLVTGKGAELRDGVTELLRLLAGVAPTSYCKRALGSGLFKARVIGRGGANIRSLEKRHGVRLAADSTGLGAWPVASMLPKRLEIKQLRMAAAELRRETEKRCEALDKALRDMYEEMSSEAGNYDAYIYRKARRKHRMQAHAQKVGLGDGGHLFRTVSAEVKFKKQDRERQRTTARRKDAERREHLAAKEQLNKLNKARGVPRGAKDHISQRGGRRKAGEVPVEVKAGAEEKDDDSGEETSSSSASPAPLSGGAGAASVEAADDEWRPLVGDEVDALHLNGEWYPAQITGIKGVTFVVEWADGDQEDRLKHIGQLRPRCPELAGTEEKPRAVVEQAAAVAAAQPLQTAPAEGLPAWRRDPAQPWVEEEIQRLLVELAPEGRKYEGNVQLAVQKLLVLKEPNRPSSREKLSGWLERGGCCSMRLSDLVSPVALADALCKMLAAYDGAEARTVRGRLETIAALQPAELYKPRAQAARLHDGLAEERVEALGASLLQAVARRVLGKLPPSFAQQTARTVGQALAALCGQVSVGGGPLLQELVARGLVREEEGADSKLRLRYTLPEVAPVAPPPDAARWDLESALVKAELKKISFTVRGLDIKGSFFGRGGTHIKSLRKALQGLCSLEIRKEVGSILVTPKCSSGPKLALLQEWVPKLLRILAGEQPAFRCKFQFPNGYFRGVLLRNWQDNGGYGRKRRAEPHTVVLERELQVRLNVLEMRLEGWPSASLLPKELTVNGLPLAVAELRQHAERARQSLDQERLPNFQRDFAAVQAARQAAFKDREDRRNCQSADLAVAGKKGTSRAGAVAQAAPEDVALVMKSERREHLSTDRRKQMARLENQAKKEELDKLNKARGVPKGAKDHISQRGGRFKSGEAPVGKDDKTCDEDESVHSSDGTDEEKGDKACDGEEKRVHGSSDKREEEEKAAQGDKAYDEQDKRVHGSDDKGEEKEKAAQETSCHDAPLNGGTEATDGEWRPLVGDEVDALHKNGKWYQAEITGIDGDTFILEWAHGDKEDRRKHLGALRPRPELTGAEESEESLRAARLLQCQNEARALIEAAEQATREAERAAREAERAAREAELAAGEAERPVESAPAEGVPEWQRVATPLQVEEEEIRRLLAELAPAGFRYEGNVQLAVQKLLVLKESNRPASCEKLSGWLERVGCRTTRLSELVSPVELADAMRKMLTAYDGAEALAVRNKLAAIAALQPAELYKPRALMRRRKKATRSDEFAEERFEAAHGSLLQAVARRVLGKLHAEFARLPPRTVGKLLAGLCGQVWIGGGPLLQELFARGLVDEEEDADDKLRLRYHLPEVAPVAPPPDTARWDLGDALVKAAKDTVSFTVHGLKLKGSFFGLGGWHIRTLRKALRSLCTLQIKDVSSMVVILKCSPGPKRALLQEWLTKLLHILAGEQPAFRCKFQFPDRYFRGMLLRNWEDIGRGRQWAQPHTVDMERALQVRINVLETRLEGWPSASLLVTHLTLYDLIVAVAELQQAADRARQILDQEKLPKLQRDFAAAQFRIRAAIVEREKEREKERKLQGGPVAAEHAVLVMKSERREHLAVERRKRMARLEHQAKKEQLNKLNKARGEYKGARDQISKRGGRFKSGEAPVGKDDKAADEEESIHGRGDTTDEEEEEEKAAQDKACDEEGKNVHGSDKRVDEQEAAQEAAQPAATSADAAADAA